MHLRDFFSVALMAGLSLWGSALAQQPEPETRRAAPVASDMVALSNSMEVINDERPLARGDELSFRVVEDDESAAALRVTDSGEVEVPYVGRVSAVGRTCRQLAQEIKSRLEKEYFYQATVMVGLNTAASAEKNMFRGRVYVTGRVQSQGPIDIPSGETFTVSKAILRAGGFAEYADRRKVKLVRNAGPDGKGGEVTIVDLIEVMEKGKAGQDPVVEPDDLVVVPEKWLNF